MSVGENARMQCAASHDLSLDITFIWSLNSHAVDFDNEKEYYQHAIVSIRAQQINVNINSIGSVSDISV